MSRDVQWTLVFDTTRSTHMHTSWYKPTHLIKPTNVSLLWWAAIYMLSYSITNNNNIQLQVCSNLIMAPLPTLLLLLMFCTYRFLSNKITPWVKEVYEPFLSCGVDIDRHSYESLTVHCHASCTTCNIKRVSTQYCILYSKL